MYKDTETLTFFFRAKYYQYHTEVLGATIARFREGGRLKGFHVDNGTVLLLQVVS